MAEGKKGETLIAFESGHYKKVKGEWKGDSVWCHFQKPDGGMIHVNKDKVEYMESFGDGVDKGTALEIRVGRLEAASPFSDEEESLTGKVTGTAGKGEK